MEGFIGNVTVFGGNFAPRTTAFCQGAILSISEYQSLYALIGTYYGGDGRTTFGLPDLRGRSVVGVGQGIGLNNVNIGEKVGHENTVLSVANIPAHNHLAVFTSSGGGSSASLNALNKQADQTDPDGNMLAQTTAGAGAKNDPIYATYANGDQVVQMDPLSITGSGSSGGTVTIDNTGGGQSFNNRSPGLGIYYVIFLTGIYPSRN